MFNRITEDHSEESNSQALVVFSNMLPIGLSLEFFLDHRYNMCHFKVFSVCMVVLL